MEYTYTNPRWGVHVAKKECEIEGCGRQVRALGLCNSHYIRQRTLGEPTAGGPFRGGPLAWIRAHVDYAGGECLIWPYARNNRGYGRIRASGREHLAHRFMLRLTSGDPPYGLPQAAHSCGNGHLGCCNPNHLSWSSQTLNELDKISHGTRYKGEQHPLATIDEATVLELVRLHKDGATYRQIQSRYRIKTTTLSSILNGHNWSWLTGIKPVPKVPKD